MSMPYYYRKTELIFNTLDFEFGRVYNFVRNKILLTDVNKELENKQKDSIVYGTARGLGVRIKTLHLLKANTSADT